ncbi:uncharacterized protein [Palaemon carinicauda]|uniref:uncharacterized protein n=1 Tax=Palaemon carinicauda TaxID=392227 RepID=UPI0035B5D076
MLNSAGIQSHVDCALNAESLLASTRNMERMLSSLQTNPLVDKTQEEVACATRKILSAFSNVAKGTASLTKDEKEEVQSILDNLSQSKFKQLSKALIENQKSNEALKRSLENRLEYLSNRKRLVEEALSVAKSR